MESLHDLKILTDDPGITQALQHSNTECKTFTNVRVMFDNHENELIKIIRQYRKGAIFGCVAWLTSEPVLKELALCENVQIIVQKEDFLRPESASSFWKDKLHRLYAALSFEIPRYDMKYGIDSLSICASPTVEPVRCVGNHNKDKNPAFPRAHHKFLVFCDVGKTITEYGDTEEYSYTPKAVWTGSYNITYNATRSFENVVYLEDLTGVNPVIQAFLHEHHQILAISEPLNWTSDWCEPEYRIGT